MKLLSFLLFWNLTSLACVAVGLIRIDTFAASAWFGSAGAIAYEFARTKP